MLVKNVLKGIKHKPLRIIGIVLLVLLAGLLYVSVQYTLTTADTSVKQYVKDYNQEDFSFDMNPSLTQKEKDTYGNNQYLYQLSPNDQQTIINNRIHSLDDQYKITIENRQYKQLDFNSTQLNKTITLRVFTNNQNIDKTYVEKGRLPESNNEIAIGSMFAEKNNLTLGDNLSINGTNYKIVGYIYLVDYIYPQLSSGGFAFDASKQVLAVFNDTDFNNFQAPQVTYYVGTFNKGSYTKADINKIDNDFFMTNLVDSKTAFRTGAIYGEIKADKAMINDLTAVILILSVVVIGIIVNKSINTERNQIGVVKSLGYSNRSILRAYMIYPLIASIVGSLIGYLIGYYLSGTIVSFFELYYQMPIGAVHFNTGIFLYSILLPIIALNLFSMIVIYFIVKKPPLDLMRVKVTRKTNFFVRKLNPLFKRLSFKQRFKYSIALRGVGKLVITFVGVLIASIYLVFALSFGSSFNRILGSATSSGDYKYQTVYQQPITTPKATDDDRFMELPANLVVKDKNIAVQLMGIDENLNHYQLVNDKNKNLIPELYNTNGDENVAVISSMISMTQHLNVGDTMTIKTITTQTDNNGNTIQKEELHQVKVVGIVENYITPYVFMRINTVNSYYKLDSSWYNGVWTNTKMTDNVKSIVDKNQQSKSIEQMMGVFKGFIYLMVGVAVILAIIVLILIAIFNIEDNFKTISFLKVMGYRAKEVSHMVLNIYAPIIIISYLLAIPLTLLSLKSLMASISSELNFAIPFTLSFVQIVIGLGIIIVTYYASLIIARRKLNKISLQEALKINE